MQNRRKKAINMWFLKNLIKFPKYENQKTINLNAIKLKNYG